MSVYVLSSNGNESWKVTQDPQKNSVDDSNLSCTIHLPSFLTTRPVVFVLSCWHTHTYDTSSEVRRLLKTFLFCWDSAPCDFLFKCAVYKYTYLLTYLHTHIHPYRAADRSILAPLTTSAWVKIFRYTRDAVVSLISRRHSRTAP